MSELVSLVETNLRSKISIILGEEKRKKKIINIIAFIIFCIVCMEFSFVKAFNVLHSSNSEGLILNSIINLEFVVISLLVFQKILTTFYLASDWKEMMVYPIKPGSLLVSKCIRCYFTSLLVAIFMLVLLFSYGFLSEASISYYFHITLYQIIIAAVPTTYIGLITLTIFWIIAVVKNPRANHKNNKWIILMDLVIMLLTYICIKADLNKDVKINNLLINMFFSGSFSEQMLIKFALTIAIILIGALGFYLFGDVYLTIMKSEVFASKTSRKVEPKASEYDFKLRKIITSNIAREIKLLMRIPALRFNCITLNAVYSMVGVIGLILLSKPLITVRTMAIDIKSFLIIVWFLTFQIANATVITSFSREGRALNQLKVFPVKTKEILLSKFCVGLLSNIFAFINVNVLLALLSANLFEFLLMEVIILIYVIGITIIEMELDINSMELKWVDIKDLFKIGHILKIMKPYFILTLLPIVFIIVGGLMVHGKLKVYLIEVVLIFIMVIYATCSYKKIIEDSK